MSRTPIAKTLYCAVTLAWASYATVAVAQQQEEPAPAAEEAKPAAGFGGFLKGVTNSLNGAIKKANGAMGAREKPAVSKGQPDAAGNTAGATTAGAAAGQAEPAKAAPSGTPIKQTALAGLFAKNPYDGTPKSYFPRVALTITDWSRGDCWTAVAVIWHSKSKSENVPPFSVCWNTSLGFALNNAANLHLFMEQSAIEHSGNVRSIGPKPPMMAVPMQTPLDERSQQSYQSFIEQIVVDTGWQAGAPTNFWLVGFDPKGSKGVASVPVSGNGGGAGADRTAGHVTSGGGATEVGQAVSGTRCRPENFTQDKYNRIVAGMSYDAVKGVIGCEPDPDFTQRSSYGVYYMWAVTINNLVAARSIGVHFDPTGAKIPAAAKDFKSAKGF